MSYLKYAIGLVSIFLLSCKSQSKRIIVDDEFAEGEISIGKDTIYNGLIKFYDTAKNNLISEAWYENGTLNGMEITYYPNGQIMTKANYINGKENGYELYYDSSGRLIQKSFYYYDVNIGPIIEYKDNNISKYRFYSFDNYRLFYIDYDSIKDKRIEDLKQDFFFINRNFVIEDPTENKIKDKYFIYVINPPQFDFKYSFCVVDSSNKIIKKVRDIDTSKIWDIFTTDREEKTDSQFFAFKLDIFQNGKLLATLYDKHKD